MNDPTTRPSLIVRLASGQDQQAWWSFVETYEPFLRYLIARQGVPVAHQNDVCQSVLIAIANSVDGWKDDGKEASFRRWLYRVARNVVLKFMAKQRRSFLAQGGTDANAGLAEIPDPHDPLLDQTYEHELVVWAAHRVQDEFAESSWQAFWATMIEGQSVAETAQRLGISVGSIYMSRSRILKRIRQVVCEVTQ